MTRRIVTGNNSEGKSYFVHDGPSPMRLNMGMVIHDQFWIDDPAAPDPARPRILWMWIPSTYTRL